VKIIDKVLTTERRAGAR